MKRMHLRWNIGWAIVVAAAAAVPGSLWGDDFPATTATVGHNGDTLVTPVNQLVTPTGTLVELPGVRPNALALSPDGRLLVTAGLTHELWVLDPETGRVRQQVVLPTDTMTEQGPVVSAILNPNEKAQLSFTGLKFSPDGTRIYFANVNGDIKVFGVARDLTVSPLFSLPLPAVANTNRPNEIAAGLAVSADGRRLYVAGNLSNRLLELDAATGKVLRTWNVGVAPFDVVLAGRKVYVSNWGGRRPGADSTVGPAGQGTFVRTEARGVASEGSVTVIELEAGAAATLPAREIILGPHASALALSPNGRWLVAASTGSDMLSVIDTRSDEVVESVTARQNPADLFGAQPDALAFDATGKTLYCANATQNAVAVFHFEPRQTRLLGCIPTGWFPSAVVYDARDKKICVANLKDITRKVEKAKVGATGLGFNSRQFDGSLSLIPLPAKEELAFLSQKVLDNLRYPLLAQAGLPPRRNRAAVPVPERTGETSVFKHVLYIIKENRSYDQVLGDVATGNGAPELCSFGAQVTPNQHQLVHGFVLLDNTYCSGILSADGHNWTDSALASDYLERSFAGWARSYPAGGFGLEGADALAYSPAGFIWDDALAHGRTFHDFGEYITTTKHWEDPTQTGKIGFADVWHDFVTGGHAIAYTGQPDIDSLRPYMETDFPSWDLNVPDVVRAAKFTAWLKAREATGDLPALTILWLPNDHTSGTKAGAPSPRAQVADNDLAMGQVVEALSRSPFWTNTCVFAIEDDPQNGWDHLSGYRTTAYVVSPYTRHGAVVHTQYNSTSLLRTMELILGLPPMNQFDATATPMFDCFTNTPDFAVFAAVTNQVPLDETNPPPRHVPDAERRHDAYVSGRLPLDKPDQCNEDILNRILWRATMGSRPYPDWAVKSVDED